MFKNTTNQKYNHFIKTKQKLFFQQKYNYFYTKYGIIDFYQNSNNSVVKNIKKNFLPKTQLFQFSFQLS